MCIKQADQLSLLWHVSPVGLIQKHNSAQPQAASSNRPLCQSSFGYIDVRVHPTGKPSSDILSTGRQNQESLHQTQLQ